jgi:hypothetical protein
MDKASKKQHASNRSAADKNVAASASSEQSGMQSSVHNAQPARRNWGGARAGSGGGPRLNKYLGSLKHEVLTYRQRYGKMPLDHLMNALNEECPPKAKGEKEVDYLHRQVQWLKRQDWAAVQAAPFMHAKLASIEITATGPEPVKQEVDLSLLNREELVQLKGLVTKARKKESTEITLGEDQYHEA